jgi:hypothetical protein
MKRKSLLLFLSAFLALAAPAAADDVFLLGFTGFDYQDPNPAPGYLEVGEGYKAVGFITSVGPLLAPYFDFGVNQYTFHLFDLTVASNVSAFGFTEVHCADGGRGRYYSDPLAGGTPGTYGTNPPNATSPSSFTDGTMELGGSLDNFVVVYNFNTNQGNFGGDMTLDEGPQLIYIPPAQRAGWILGGLAGRPNATVPTGYDNQISGECRIPDVTPTSHKTWGSVKALYR